MSRQVLFVCSGNYYRSRYAEMLFNALAEQARLDWTAISRGFVLSPGNVGPISNLTLEALATGGFATEQPVRMPMLLQQADLDSSDLVVAVKEAEHRPRFERQFPAWVDRVEYWHVHDLDQTSADEALGTIKSQVESLIVRLAAEDGASAE